MGHLKHTILGLGSLALFLWSIPTSGCAWMTACAREEPPMNPSTTPGRYRILEQGTTSAWPTELETIYRDPAKWQDFYRIHRPGTPVPPVHFDREQVAVIVTQRMTGGYELIVDRLEQQTSGALTLHYTEVTPAPDQFTIQILTQPYLLIVLPAGTAPIRFARHQKTARAH